MDGRAGIWSDGKGKTIAWSYNGQGPIERQDWSRPDGLWYIKEVFNINVS